MNILGLNISIDRSATAKVKWTRRAAAVGTINAIVLTGGTAYAFWSTDGSGTGAAQAGTAKAVTGAVASVQTSGTLVPSSTAPLVVNIHNPNDFSIKVSAVSVAAAAQPSGVTGGSGCTAGNSAVSLAAASASSLNVSIAGNGDGTVTLNSPNPVSMGLASDNGCQGATFTFTSGVSVTAAAG